MRHLTFFAGDPLYFVARESGWVWLLTPVKSTALLAAYDQAGHLAWFTPHLWGNRYLDLRVVAIDLILLVALTVVIPLIVRNRSQSAWIGDRVSATAGVLFGLAITYFSLASSTWWVVLGAFGVTVLLFGVGLLVINSRGIEVPLPD